MDNKKILVVGVTGQQGGAVARQLLKDEWQVYGLTRNANSPTAQAVSAKGIQLIEGNLDDRASLDKALEGMYGVFSVQNFMDKGVEGETEQGIRLADAAQDASIQHFIYSSVGGADRNTGIPHFESKWKIEQHIQTLGLPATILRPTLFMDMFASFGFRTMLLTMLSSMVRRDKGIQVIAVEDIGTFARIAFNDPATYIGKALEIAGDELSPVQLRQAISKASGQFVPYVKLPRFMTSRLPEEMSTMLNWFDTFGYQANISNLRQLHPTLLNFQGWWASKE